MYLTQQRQICNSAWKQAINLQPIQFFLTGPNLQAVHHQKPGQQVKVPAVAIHPEVVVQKIILLSQAAAKAKTALQKKLPIKAKEVGCVYNLL